MTDFEHHTMFPLEDDGTPYRKISDDGIGTMVTSASPPESKATTP